MVEITFEAKQAHADPFNEVTLDVVFIDPHGRELRVPAFWDGGKTWKARYASPLAGTHPFHTECSDLADKGLNGIHGKSRGQTLHGAKRSVYPRAGAGGDGPAIFGA